MKNLKLKRRVRQKSSVNGKLFDYFPAEISRRDGIKVGQRVMVTSDPVGKMGLIEVTTKWDSEWIRPTYHEEYRYKVKTPGRWEYSPKEGEKTYHIFVRDLAYYK